MAQRVMDCGDAGHIIVRKRVADDLDNTVAGSHIFMNWATWK